jgi:hypothetical protein
MSGDQRASKYYPAEDEAITKKVYSFSNHGDQSNIQDIFYSQFDA